MNRKSPYSKLYKLHTFDSGISLLLPVVDDLDDEYIQYHFTQAMESEDYEYCEILSAEAGRRNLILKIE